MPLNVDFPCGDASITQLALGGIVSLSKTLPMTVIKSSVRKHKLKRPRVQARVTLSAYGNKNEFAGKPRGH